MGQAAVTAPAAPVGLRNTHLVRNGVVAAPLLVAAAGLWRGADGATSAAFGLALATANLLIAARALEWAGGVSLNAVAAVALGGYVVRLAVITAVVLLIKDLSWADLPALGISLVVAHLGLLIVEARHIHTAAGARGVPEVTEGSSRA